MSMANRLEAPSRLQRAIHTRAPTLRAMMAAIGCVVAGREKNQTGMPRR